MAGQVFPRKTVHNGQTHPITRMKIGFILECTAKGPDADIYPYVAQQLCSSLTIEKPITLGNKLRVMTEGAVSAHTLLEIGCDYVFIIWDRMPRWGGTGRCIEHVEQLQTALQREGIDRGQVFLCCIDEMLESWIVADGRGITAHFQNLTTRNIGIFPDCKKKAEQASPKERITRFNNRYNDFTDNFKIIQRMPDFDRAARRNTSFRLFVDAVRSICLNSSR